MIAHLTGRVISDKLDTIILDVHGVGYRVHVPVGTLGRVKPDAEGRVSLFTYTSVRADAILLFGFANEDIYTLFTKLITVTGVGPKLALAILSGLSPLEFVTAVHTNSVAQLTSISGIGKKTAQRLILELKNSLDDIDLGDISPPAAQNTTGTITDDLRSALLNLGYPPAAVDSTIEKVLADTTPDENQPIEALLRSALKVLR